MDYIEEARKELENAIDLGTDDEVTFRVEVAKVHALISIAKSLEKLATAMDYNGNLLHVMALTTKDV